MVELKSLFLNTEIKIFNFISPESLTNIGWIKNNELIIMQFTGLKDKNGKEIYEGDILGIWDDRTIKKIWKIIVRFGEVDFHRDAYTNCIGFFGTELNSSMPQGLKHCLSYKRCEIIGNIYSNPELLKV